MSGYNYTHLVKEFADRTIDNLRIIENHNCDAKPKEVTQLINSFLGLLVVPSERYKEKHDQREKEEKALRNSSPDIYSDVTALIQCLTLSKKLYNDYDHADQYPVCDFIHHLRNAVCHSGNKCLIMCPIEENKEIKTVIFYDTLKKDGKKYQFAAELTIEQIRILIDAISTMYIAVENAKSKDIKKEYEDAVSDYRALMEKPQCT